MSFSKESLPATFRIAEEAIPSHTTGRYGLCRRRLLSPVASKGTLIAGGVINCTSGLQRKDLEDSAAVQEVCPFFASLKPTTVAVGAL